MKLGYYDIGATPFFALQADQRVSYCLHVPRGIETEDPARYRLVVTMHGTGRTATAYRDAFADFAEAHRCVILAPLFPVGLIEPGELSNYKRIKFHDMRFDRLLLAMVDEVTAKYGIDARRFLLFGFSGGGHFTHRFLYLHPNRLAGASIGAPGGVTLLDDTRDWWVGTRNFAAEFGQPLDYGAMRRVQVQMVIGAEDKETWEITLKPGDRGWMPDANIAGVTRLDRMQSLKASFERHGIAVRHDVVPGVAHQGTAVLAPVKAFFADVLKAARAADAA